MADDEGADDDGPHAGNDDRPHDDENDDRPHDDENDGPAAPKGVPSAMLRPLANGLLFAVIWTAGLLVLGRDAPSSLLLGLLGGGMYFAASYAFRR